MRPSIRTITTTALIAVTGAVLPVSTATAATPDPTPVATFSDASHTTVRTVIAVSDMLVSAPDAVAPQSAHTTVPLAGTRGPVVIDGACLTFVRGLDHGYRSRCTDAPEQQFDAVPTIGGVTLLQGGQAVSASKRESVRTMTLQVPGAAKYLQVVAQR